MRFETFLNAFELATIAAAQEAQAGRTTDFYLRRARQAHTFKERVLEMWDLSKSETFHRQFEKMSKAVMRQYVELDYEQKRSAVVVSKMAEQREALKREIDDLRTILAKLEASK
jgi:predicted ArsR family transcriptional regulator